MSYQNFRFKIRRGRRGTYKTFNITTIPAEAHNTQITVPKILNAEIGELKAKLTVLAFFLVFIDTRTNFRYVLTKAFNQEVVGGALVRYNYNLNRRARKTKAMFTITGRLLNDVVIQVGGDPKVGPCHERVLNQNTEISRPKISCLDALGILHSKGGPGTKSTAARRVGIYWSLDCL